MKRKWIIAMCAIASVISTSAYADEADTVAQGYVARFAEIVSGPSSKSAYFDATCRLLLEGVDIDRWAGVTGWANAPRDKFNDDKAAIGYIAAYMLKKTNYFEEHKGKTIQWIKVGSNGGRTWGGKRVKTTEFRVRSGGDTTEIYVYNGRIFDMFIMNESVIKSAGSEMNARGLGDAKTFIADFNRNWGGKERCP